MHWDRLFEDLEGQLASEWESERAALDAESERLRISRLDLRSRLRTLCAVSAPVTVDLPGDRRVRSRLHALGADWVAAAVIEAEGVSTARTTRLFPLAAIRGLTLEQGLLLASLEEGEAPSADLRERMSLGFVLRDLARRRVPVRIVGMDGPDLHGTIDRAGADHLDLALHDPGEARLAGAVRGFRVLPFSALVSVQALGDQMP
ncbi:hypothetical protein [Microbacterium sp. H83]|uniref:hypothetical protein n=1 Tax=Microbacterium sp. H83 TaxID=1827324 RepID=UPI0007F3D07A|nr:hypothetical protein [Microbacterium sp. H83]OAN43558.1 hypothetical protein A4X16_01400 [Microbacterium sp. H83]